MQEEPTWPWLAADRAFQVTNPSPSPSSFSVLEAQGALGGGQTALALLLTCSVTLDQPPNLSDL